MFHKDFQVEKKSANLYELIAAYCYQITDIEWTEGCAQLPVVCCWSQLSLSGSCFLHTILTLLWKYHLGGKRSFELCIHHMISKNIIKSAILQAKLWKKWNGTLLGEKKISLLWKNYLRWWTEGGLRECSQQWPYLSPLPSLSLIGSGLMNDRRGREGWGVDRTCLQSCPSPHNVRKTRDCCVQATEGWHGVKEGGGKGGCTGTEH